jgi:hypothetical protein
MQLAASTVGDPLETLVWERRVLVVLAPAPGDERAEETFQRLKARACEVDDRDLTAALAPQRGEGWIDDRPLTRAEVYALRTRFRAGVDDFVVVLVGKDGGEKLRLTEPPSLDQVFALIDEMPMRRAEMRARTNRCRL